MFDISKVDSNFAIESKINKTDIKFYNIEDCPFKIYGVIRENGKYRRMPENIAKTVSEGVYGLSMHNAGGRVKFITDSSYVAIHTIMGSLEKLPHFSLTGSIGFDLYVNADYIKTFVPPFDIEDGYESVVEFETKEMR